MRFQNEAYYLAVTQAIADKLSALLFNGTDSGVLTYVAPSPQGGDGWMQLCIVMKVGSESTGRDTHSNGHSIPLFLKGNSFLFVPSLEIPLYSFIFQNVPLNSFIFHGEKKP